MPLYDLVVIARAVKPSAQTGFQAPIAKKVAKQISTFVINNGGVVRDVELLSGFQEPLPYRMKKHQEIFDTGCYFSVQFYASPQVTKQLHRELNFNNDVIRRTTLKIGDTLYSVTKARLPEKMV